MSKPIIMTCLLLTFFAAITPADSGSLLDEVRKYREHVDQTERSAKKTSIQELIQEGALIADKLRPIIEDLSETDYDIIEKGM